MKTIIDNLILGTASFILLAAFPNIISAQNSWTEPPAKRGKPERIAKHSLPRPMVGGDTSEKSIRVDNNVNLTVCVTQGTIKVNGWNRNELRVFVHDGSKFGFKVQLKSPKTGDPALIMITGLETRNKYASPTECIWGGDIEIDAPVNATINLKGRETTTTIDSVKKININTVGGDISARNIRGGVTASAGQGDVMVEESEGAMILDSTTGNILVFEAGPSEIGDMFKAKTNSGSISLQRLEYRQIEVGSISGSVAFNGEILSGGSYSLSTSRGSIHLAIPANSACKFSVTYGFGTFNSELPYKTLTENVSEGPIKSVVATFGKGGDALLRLTTNNGSISIKKQENH